MSGHVWLLILRLMPYRGTPVARLRAVIAAQREIASHGIDIQPVMNATTACARELTMATAAVLELSERDELVYRAASGTGTEALGKRTKIEHSLSGRALREGRILFSNDAEHDDRVDQEARQALGIRSVICVPLLHEDQELGVLMAYSHERGFFEEDDISTLELMGGFITTAVAHAVAERAWRGTEQSFRALAELAKDAIITVDIHGTTTFCNASAEHMFGYSEQEILGQPFTMLLSERNPMREAMDEGSFDPARIMPKLRTNMELMGRRRDGSEFPIEFSASHWKVQGQTNFAAIVRDVAERTRLEQVVLEMAQTDHRTGLSNRRSGEEAIRREVARALRYGSAVSVVLLDIDHFKRINDSAGHAGGDEVLERLGELLRQRLRATDTPIRWGGEEFLVLLPATDLDSAFRLAEMLRGLIESNAFNVVPQVTVSAGVATLAPNEHGEQLIGRADAKLYEAKNAGRNRVAR